MTNTITVQNENGEIIIIDMVLSFRIEETKKEYIAYTMNDTDSKSLGMVLISEIDSETNRIKEIPESDKEIVLNSYEEAKKAIVEGRV